MVVVVVVVVVVEIVSEIRIFLIGRLKYRKHKKGFKPAVFIRQFLEKQWLKEVIKITGILSYG